MSLQRQHILLSYFKTLSVGPVWDSNPRPPSRRSTNWANRSAVIFEGWPREIPGSYTLVAEFLICHYTCQYTSRLPFHSFISQFKNVLPGKNKRYKHSHLAHIRALDRHFVSVSFSEHVWPWVTVSQSDLVGFAISTNDLIEWIYLGVQDFSNFDAHCQKITVLYPVYTQSCLKVERNKTVLVTH